MFERPIEPLRSSRIRSKHVLGRLSLRQSFFRSLRRIDVDALNPNDASWIDAVGDRVALAEKKGEVSSCVLSRIRRSNLSSLFPRLLAISLQRNDLPIPTCL
jgi:hypothetical protein